MSRVGLADNHTSQSKFSIDARCDDIFTSTIHATHSEDGWGALVVENELPSRDTHSARSAPFQQTLRIVTAHHEIWKYCQSTSIVHAKVLQNLRVRLGTRPSKTFCVIM